MMKNWKRTVCAVLCGGMMLSPASLTAFAEETSGVCGDGVTWKIDSDNTLTISGSGAVTDAAWSSYASGIQKAVVEEGVTALPDGAFFECSALTGVSLPDSLQSIGTACFWMCSTLEELTIPAGVTEIGYEAFYKCDQLPAFAVAEGNTAYTAEDGILYTKDGGVLVAYPKQKTDTAFTVPDGVKTIEPAAFSENPYLETITLSAAAEEIRTLAFYNCLALTEIIAPEENAGFVSEDGVLFSKDKTAVIAYPMAKEETVYTVPDGITAIGEAAFAGTDLTEITLLDGIVTIGMDAFYNCTELAAVTLPDTVTGIGDHAFAYCTSLTGITVPAATEEVGYYAFYGCEGLAEASFLNVYCDICNDPDTLPEATVLRSYADSAAALYAEKYGRKFEELPEAAEITLGDVNADGSINAKDANAVLIAAARLGTNLSSGLSDAEVKAGDVTGDETLNARDAANILRYAAAFGTGQVITFEELNQ